MTKATNEFEAAAATLKAIGRVKTRQAKKLATLQDKIGEVNANAERLITELLSAQPGPVLELLNERGALTDSDGMREPEEVTV